MKKMLFALMVMLTTTVSASAMSYEQARNEALFLTDKMAYELNLTDAQYEAAYEINLDYLMGVTSYDDVFGTYWERRNLDLSYILYSWQWDLFRAATYFYRPLYWDAGYWHFAIYARYPHRDYFYFGRPHFYATYRGGHSWRINGGHSYYHGRADHFRPALPNGRQHFGMRNSFDRGDFRGSRAGSSTRVTGRQDHRFNDRPNRGEMGGSRSSNHNQNGSGHFGGNRSTGSMGSGNRPSGSTHSSGSMGSENRPSGSMGSGNRPSTSMGSGNRPSGSSGSSATPSRSFGGSRSSGSMGSGSRPSTSSGSSAAPSRSFGGSHSSGSMGSRSSSSGASRSAGSSSGSRSSSGGGHFGGNGSHRR